MSVLHLIIIGLGLIGPLMAQFGPTFSVRNVSALKISLLSSDAIITGSDRIGRVEVWVERPWGQRGCLSTSTYKRDGRAFMEESANVPGCDNENLWHISVPQGLTIEIISKTGNVRVEQLEGELTLRLMSGEITVVGGAGDLTATTFTGNITIQEFLGDLNISTASGSVDIRDADGGLKVNSVTGDLVLTNVRARVIVNSGSGNISGAGIALISTSAFYSNLGNLDIALVKSLSSDARFSSHSGDVNLAYYADPLQGTWQLVTDPLEGSIQSAYTIDTVRTIKAVTSAVTDRTIYTLNRGKGPHVVLRSVSGIVRLN